MSSVPSLSSAYTQHAEALASAQQRLVDAKQQESEARREATAAENALRETEKAFAAFLTSQHPSLVDVIAQQRGRR